MPVSFLHTADWQIGRAFARFPEEAAVPLRQQRIETIKTIASEANQRNVDAVMVAGDVFDLSNVADKTVRLVVNAMSAFKGKWLLLPGNHDPGTADSVWAQMRRLSVPDNVHILDQAATPFWLIDDQVVVLPAPLLRKHEANDPTQWFDGFETPAHVIRIGLAHGSVDNRLPDRGDAPNTICDTRAEKADLDYLALGDWHGCMSIGKRTWYSGTHETDRFRDNDSGNILHVRIDSHSAQPAVERIKVGKYRWRQCSPNLHGNHAAEELSEAIEALGEPFDSLVLQIAPRGTSSLSINHKIATVIANWEARVTYLEYCADELIAEASDEELTELGSTGFMGLAVENLRNILNDANHPENAYAELALQLLYSEHKLLGGRK